MASVTALMYHPSNAPVIISHYWINSILLKTRGEEYVLFVKQQHVVLCAMQYTG